MIILIKYYWLFTDINFSFCVKNIIKKSVLNKFIIEICRKFILIHFVCFVDHYIIFGVKQKRIDFKCTVCVEYYSSFTSFSQDEFVIKSGKSVQLWRPYFDSALKFSFNPNSPTDLSRDHSEQSQTYFSLVGNMSPFTLVKHHIWLLESPKVNFFIMSPHLEVKRGHGGPGENNFGTYW